MKSLLSLVLFSSLVIGGYSAVFFEHQPEIPGHEGQCHDQDDNVFYKAGELMKWRVEECGRKICLGSNGKGTTYIQMQTCGTIRVPPECVIKVNKDLPYPQCCGKIVCPKPLKLHLQNSLA